MIYNQVLVRYGDLTLKGKNQKTFIKRLHKLIDNKLAGLNVNILKQHDRVYIEILDEDYNKIIEALDKVSGLSSYSLVVKTNNDIEQIKEAALLLVNDQVKKPVTFKLESRRADKRFPLTSQEISKVVAAHVLPNNSNLKADMHNPDLVLNVEVRNEATYLYLSKIQAIGGFPVGIAGKGLLMISGGIDSPVAGFLTQKQGIEIECLHFESTPLTSIESAQKVVDLVKIMANYSFDNKIKTHMIPFKDLHKAILDNIPDPYTITIMRRMMYKIACRLANKLNIPILINGESIGQVASQTLNSMNVINKTCDIPVIRPLATYDKNDIVKIAKKINTFTTSIKPFEDCCTIYVPKSPTTSPKLDICLKYESYFNFEPLIDECVEKVLTIDITTTSNIDLPSLGFEVRECQLKQK
ncbi:MAG: tRNA uracil 4-sulfurtransferase ThiI [Anaeroplasmataceae bacterium]